MPIHYSDAQRISIGGHVCVYCGEPADTKEHFPPKSSEPYRGYILSACKECNSLASTHHPYCFQSRAEYVRKRLKAKRRNRKLLNTPLWAADELEDMSPELAQYCRVWNAEVIRLRNRVAHSWWDALTDAGWDRYSFEDCLEDLLKEPEPEEESVF